MVEPVSLASRVRIPEGLLSHTFQDELVMLNMSTGVYFGLDPIGTRIWQLIHEHQPIPLQDLLDSLVEEYAVTDEQCGQDLLDLVAQMQEHQLLEVVD
jgi:hypothetical protein